MDESADTDASYPLSSLTPSTSVDRFSNSANHGSLQPDSTFPFDSSFDTISPASLELFHTSHDDTCVYKCTGHSNPQRLQHRGFPSHGVSRPRFATSPVSLPFYNLSDNNSNNIFQSSTPPFSHMPLDSFPNIDLRYGLDGGVRHTSGFPTYESQLGNHFSASDLGIMSQSPVPDDCTSLDCSRFSCSSQCCSTQVCQDESCSGGGTPCEDMHCFDGISQPLDEMWNMQQDWNTEHDAALTLQDLSAPGALSPNNPLQRQQQQKPLQQQQQESGFPELGSPSFGTADDSVHHDLSLSLPGQPVLPYVPCILPHPFSVQSAAQAPSGPNQHVCQWVVGRGTSGTQDRACGLVFNNPESLQDHLCESHIASMSSKTKYVCLWEGCSRRGDQVFASRNKLRRHISTHSAYKPLVCHICHQGFSAVQALEQHVRTHTGETPFHCDVEGCNKSFKQKSALTMHKRTHTGEKPLACEICGKCFCESSNLSKHRKTHNPDFKYKCEEPGCESKFIRVDQLRRHMTRHSNKTARQKKQQQRSRSLTNIPTPTETPVSSETPEYHIILDNDDLDTQA